MITVLGSAGFIGRHLVKKLSELGLEFLSPGREEQISHIPLGDIFYCIGLTADFRQQPLATVEAHVCKLLHVLRDCQFTSMLYLSSARVYGNHLSIAREDDRLEVEPLEQDHVYNISKIMGESLLLTSNRKVRVARLSNVYGADFESENFVSSIIRDAVSNGKMTVRSSPESAKDYINVDDVIDGLIKIATAGKHSVYNLASGKNTTNQALVRKISELTGCEVVFAPNPADKSFAPISIERMQNEFSFQPSDVLDDLDQIIDLYKSNKRLWHDKNRS